MRTHILAAIALVTVAACPCGVLGGVIVSLNNPGGTTEHQIEVQPASTFTVNVNAAPTPDMVGIEYRLVASTGNILMLTGATLYEPWDSTLSTVPLGPLTPTSEMMILTVATFGPQRVSSPLAALTLAVAPDVQPGLYHINISEISCWGSRLFEPRPGQPGADFNILVLPEPSSIGMIAVIGLFFSHHWFRGGKNSG